MKHTLSILAFMLPLLLTGQKSAMEDFFKEYLAGLDNLGDASFAMDDRHLFRADILANYFLPVQGSVLYNHFRPDGTAYVPASEYLDIIITDFPRGISFSYEGLEIANFQMGDKGSEAIVDLSWSVTVSGRRAQKLRHRFVLDIIGLSSSRVSARIKSMDQVPAAPNPAITQEAPSSGLTLPEPSQPASSLPVPIQELQRNMVRVEGGSFTMGCTAEQGEDCYYNEKPAHTVKLNTYYIGKYEVTQAEWLSVTGENPSFFSGCPSCPVESISWFEVQEFISKLNELSNGSYRLPTEAEWEYAARGGNLSLGYKYSGSDYLDSVGWYGSNSRSAPHPVGLKSPNELGLYDMSGNVWEWCSDWYINYYSESPILNPQGPPQGADRVYRGGDYHYDARYNRVSYRYGYNPESTGKALGFRLVSSYPAY